MFLGYAWQNTFLELNFVHLLRFLVGADGTLYSENFKKLLVFDDSCNEVMKKFSAELNLDYELLTGKIKSALTSRLRANPNNYSRCPSPFFLSMLGYQHFP